MDGEKDEQTAGVSINTGLQKRCVCSSPCIYRGHKTL